MNVYIAGSSSSSCTLPVGDLIGTFRITVSVGFELGLSLSTNAQDLGVAGVPAPADQEKGVSLQFETFRREADQEKGVSLHPQPSSSAVPWCRLNAAMGSVPGRVLHLPINGVLAPPLLDFKRL